MYYLYYISLSFATGTQQIIINLPTENRHHYDHMKKSCQSDYWEYQLKLLFWRLLKNLYPSIHATKQPGMTISADSKLSSITNTLRSMLCNTKWPYRTQHSRLDTSSCWIQKCLRITKINPNITGSTWYTQQKLPL